MGEKIRLYFENLFFYRYILYFIYKFLSILCFWPSTSTKYHFWLPAWKA